MDQIKGLRTYTPGFVYCTLFQQSENSYLKKWQSVLQRRIVRVNTQAHIFLCYKTPVTHSRMTHRIAPDFLIWKMLSDLRIIFCVRTVIRNVRVRSVAACCGSVVTCQGSDKISRPLRKNLLRTDAGRVCRLKNSQMTNPLCSLFIRKPVLGAPWQSIADLWQICKSFT